MGIGMHGSEMVVNEYLKFSCTIFVMKFFMTLLVEQLLSFLVENLKIWLLPVFPFPEM